MNPFMKDKTSKKRILWFSNNNFSDKDSGNPGGTWHYPLAKKLIDTGEIELCNVLCRNVKTPFRQDAGPILQWVVPDSKHKDDGLPSVKIVNGILEVIKAFSPDIVHMWGTEYFHGLLTARKLIQSPALLEIQGLKEPYARVYAGGLTGREQRACIGFKELIKKRSIASGRRAFEKWSCYEREIIAGHRFIATQSPWVEAWIKNSNNSARIFHSELILREPFYNASPWRPQNAPIIFCSFSYPVPYKGIHDAVKTFALLKKNIPNARMHIAGAVQSSGIRQDGYIAMINRMAVSMNIEKQIDWLGPLSAINIVKELQNCSLMLMRSHCETYCVAMAEALYLGVPVVTAHTGGTNWLGRDEESALFFCPGDEVMCAYQLERILTNKGLAKKLSHNARSIALKRNDHERIVKNQVGIYRQIIANKHSDILNK